MFNYKKFLRAVPAPMVSAYLEDQAFPIPEEFDWDQAEDHFAKAIGQVVDTADDPHRANLIENLLEASALGSEAGCRAILNALEPSDPLVEALRDMESYEQRALWVHWKDERRFEAACEILFFDDHSIKQETKRIRLTPGLPLSLDEADLRALAADVAAFYRKKEGSGNACEIEITPRHQEGATQLTLYVEGLVNNRPEFDGGRLRRRRSRPAMELALVYHAGKGIIETAVRGGKQYHQMLLERFRNHLLKTDSDPELLQPEKFKLQNLQFGVTVFDADQYGIEQVRIKSLVLYATDGTGGTLTIGAPARNADISADYLAAHWFVERNPLQTQFRIVQAAIAIHFMPTSQGRRPRPLYVEFRRDGTMKRGKISEKHRALVDELLVEWGLVEQSSATSSPER